jgi:parallel beta-helix repeat protein
MTIDDAKRILGLRPDENPASCLPQLGEAREKIAELVRSAPNDVIALRYQNGLMEFDRALAAVRENRLQKDAEMALPVMMDFPGIIPATPGTQATWSETTPEEAAPEPAPEPPMPEPIGISPDVPPDAAAPPADSHPQAGERSDADEDEQTARRSGRGGRVTLWLLLFVIGCGGGVAWYLKVEDDKRIHRIERLTFLERQGAILLENRRWADAKLAYDEIARLDPASDTGTMGYRSIEAGIQEEQSQFIAYWSGEAIAAFDTGRWDEAAQAARKVLDKFPENEEMRGLPGKIDSARKAEQERIHMENAHKAFDEGKWDLAQSEVGAVLHADPNHEAGKTLQTEITAAVEKQRADRAKARELYEKAKLRDTGKFDREASEWLREALSLSPGDAEIAALHEKFASYTRTLRVPGDFASLSEAISAAGDRDRIVLGAGTWKEELVIDKALDIQGAGAGTTIIECRAQDGCAATFGPSAKGTRVSGITFRHESFDPGLERYAVALVRGGDVMFADCRFADASGHGLEVIEGGRADASRCRFEKNGWDGAAARGKGARLEIRDCDAVGNYEHGLDVWDGAAAIFVGNRAENNSRNGIHVDAGSESVTVDNNRARGNREFGIVLGAAGAGTAKGNVLQGNLLGGMVVRVRAAKVVTTGNQSTGNSGSGLILEKGLSAPAFQDNHISGNLPPEILTDMELTGSDVPLNHP